LQGRIFLLLWILKSPNLCALFSSRFSLQLDPGSILPSNVLGNPQWACGYPSTGWEPSPIELAWLYDGSKGMSVETTIREKSESAARLVIGTCVARCGSGVKIGNTVLDLALFVLN
jgi:hypothetical protein